MKYGIIAMLAAVLATGVAIARDAGESSPIGMMEGCREMMGGGMGGMTGGSRPNEQWSSPEPKR